MKRISVLCLFLASSACFAQQQPSPTHPQATNAQIQAIREQTRAIGQANMDRQRADFQEAIRTPLADHEKEKARVNNQNAINTFRTINGQLPLK